MADEKAKGPISRNPEAVRGRILDAAEAEFMAAGYEGASTNRIVAGFAGSKSTLFRHYPTKEKLLEGVIRRIAGRWRESVEAAPIPATDPSGWLIEFAVRTLRSILCDQPLFVGRLGIAEGRKLPQLQSVFDEVAGAPLRSMLADRLHAWTQAGALRSVDPRSDAQLFFDLAFAGAVDRALYGVERLAGEPLRAHAERCVDLFLNGRGIRA